MSGFNGKAIYKPKGKAGEYAEWACNFYVGCSNGCEYCYCKTGILASQMGGDVPALKKCFKNEAHALEVFRTELLRNIDAIRESGLFFSFTTDPMLPETQDLTLNAVGIANSMGVDTSILTKCAKVVFEFIDYCHNSNSDNALWGWRSKIAIGFTLTGHNELEPNADSNNLRMSAMGLAHDHGFKTFASIEPVIDVDSSLEMIRQTQGMCDMYKVGLLSGGKYDKGDVYFLISELSKYAMAGQKIYVKDSVLKAVGMSRSELPEYFADSNYSIFVSDKEF